MPPLLSYRPRYVPSLPIWEIRPCPDLNLTMLFQLPSQLICLIIPLCHIYFREKSNYRSSQKRISNNHAFYFRQKSNTRTSNKWISNNHTFYFRQKSNTRTSTKWISNNHTFYFRKSWSDTPAINPTTRHSVTTSEPYIIGSGNSETSPWANEWPRIRENPHKVNLQQPHLLLQTEIKQNLAQVNLQ